MTEWIISSSILIAVFIILRAVFKKHISPSLLYALWLLVLVRLLIPGSIGESAASIFNHIPVSTTEHSAILSPGMQNAIIQGVELPFSPYQSSSPDMEITKAESISSPETKYFSVSEMLFVLYIFGVIIFLLLLLISNLVFGSRLKASRVEQGSFMGLRVYSSAILDTACLFGLFAPAIYLSKDVDVSREKHVLLHEHAHFRQWDHIWSVLRSLALVLHWYNPLVWLAVKLSKQDGELSCDEKVISSMHEDERISYGETLISLSCSGKTSLLCAVTPLSSKGKKLKERIEYVVKRPSSLLVHMVLLVALTLMVSACTFTGAKDKAQDDILEESIVTPPMDTVNTSPEAETPAPLGAQQGKLLDRNGFELSPDNFPLYQSTANTFEAYLKEGDTVILSIDLEFQQAVQEILENNLSTPGPYFYSGCSVILDLNSGAPLAIVGLGETIDPLSTSFTPYHLFLPCTGITALGAGLIDPDYKIKCEGVFDRYAEEGYAPECWMYKGFGTCHPEEDMDSALRDSCGYYFYALGNDCGIDEIERYAHQLGLGVPTGIELPSSNGLMPGRMIAKSYGTSWNIGHTLETSVGLSLASFTPLQIAQYCGTIANNGTRFSASIVKEIRDRDGNILFSQQPVVLNQINSLSQEDWDAIKSGLYSNFNDPINSFYSKVLTHSNGHIQTDIAKELGNWNIAGSSAMLEGMEGFNQHLLMAFAPYENPQISIAAVTITATDEYIVEQICAEIVAAYKNTQ